MSEPKRVVHYVNQFFGGVGGEDKADIPPRHQSGPVGPGRLLQEHLGSGASVSSGHAEQPGEYCRLACRAPLRLLASRFASQLSLSYRSRQR